MYLSNDMKPEIRFSFFYSKEFSTSLWCLAYYKWVMPCSKVIQHFQKAIAIFTLKALCRIKF